MRSSACSLLQLRKKTVFLFPIKLEKNNNLVKTRLSVRLRDSFLKLKFFV